MNTRPFSLPSAALIRLAGWGLVAALLAAPLIAMQVTSEVNWTMFDFAAAGVLLVGAGALLELAARKLRKPVHMVVAAGIVTLAVGLIWAQGAVGIF